MNFKENKAFFQQWLLLLGATVAWYLYQSLYTRNIWFYMMAGIGAVVLLTLIFVSFYKPKKDRVFSCKGKTNLVLGLWLGFILIATVLFFNLPYGLFNQSAARMAIAVGLAGTGALMMQASGSKKSIYLDFAVFLLVSGVLHRSLAFLNEIQSGPFSLGWSEGSRYYNASLFASQATYAQKLPLPVLHPSRYLMQAVPFWLGIRAILAHRIWQVLLWLGMTLWTSIALAKKLKEGLKLPMLWLTLFFFLFFFQGAVYYHMMVCVLMVLYGYHKDKPWRTLVFVVLASIWAGISRVNWMPLPALLAVVLYLIESPIEKGKWVRYLQFPAVWVVFGLLASWLSKQAYIRWSGEPAYVFDSAFSSALLWERLLPNKTFFIGILPGIVLLCLPLAVLVVSKLKGNYKRVHPLRWLGLAGVLLAFLAGGIVVSVKIGGGGDLHNLDAFIFLWLVIAGYILAGKLVLDSESERILPEEVSSQERLTTLKIHPFWIAIAVILPVFFAFMRAGTWQFKADQSQKDDLKAIKMALNADALKEGPILFITERQLLTFSEIEDIEVIHDYEKVFLMEMAMGNNEHYLQGFYEKLEKQAFAAIVTDPISTALQDRSRPFNEENNAWVRKVVIPMLEHYQLEQAFRSDAINLLLPKP
jgi:hypothetical protein